MSHLDPSADLVGRGACAYGGGVCVNDDVCVCVASVTAMMATIQIVYHDPLLVAALRLVVWLWVDFCPPRFPRVEASLLPFHSLSNDFDSIATKGTACLPSDKAYHHRRLPSNALVLSS